MAEGVIVIVDLGHENCQRIKEDVVSFRVDASQAIYDMEKGLSVGSPLIF